MLRSRIRIKLISHKGDILPKYLHEIDFDSKPLDQIVEDSRQVLPVLALNEVFIGEALSARVSHLQMRLNGSTEQTNMKCSGICICTGTGSTSWHLSINRLPVQCVAELLRLIDINPTDSEEVTNDNNLATVLAENYNRNLTFAAGSLLLFLEILKYSIYLFIYIYRR